MAGGEANLRTRSARERLKPSGKPYFRLIDAGLYVGYRKGKTGGKWVARRYLGDERYVVETIGTADDAQDADGETILDFSQAQDQRAHHGCRRASAGEAERPLTRWRGAGRLR